MAMDIEGFVEAPGRAEQVRQVREMIDRLGIEYLYLQFVSITGRICGKGIPRRPLGRASPRGGFQLVYGATVNLFLNRHGQYLGYGPQDKELVGIPGAGDLLPASLGQAGGAAVVHPVPQPRGAPGTGRIPDRGLPRQPSAASTSSSRPEHGGLHLRHGTEPEMMWLKRGPDGKPDGGFSNPYCYPHRPVREPAAGCTCGPSSTRGRWAST